MGLDLKKISVTTWLILGGIFLYTASLWQRPLFISEFADNCGAVKALYSGTFETCRDLVISCILKYTKVSPFSFRLPCALLALLSGGALFLAGRKSRFANISTAAPLIFLLTPAIFLSGTSALSFMLNGAPVIICFYLLYFMSESSSVKSAALWGIGALAAFAALGTLFFAGTPVPLFFILAAWLIYAVLTLLIKDPERKSLSPLSLFAPVLCVLPALIVSIFATPCQQSFFTAPRSSLIRDFAAFAVAGSFPWLLFMIAAARNFPERFKRICREPVTLSALVLAVCSGVMSLFTPASAAFFIPFLAGMAVLLAAGLEMEHEENGFHSFNIILSLLAGVFFLAAAGIGIWYGLGVCTKVLKPAWKIFTAKDAWLLTAIVPAVAAVWCLTGVGEKKSKERKFLSFCAGIAFLLLAFHGLTPVKVVEYNAPGHFLQKVVLPRTGVKTLFYGDKKMVAPLQAVCKNSQVKSFSFPSGLEEIKEGIKTGKRMCIVTLSRKTSEKLPFPKTTLRSGNFIAVFYNIDFPEMRVRKP